MVSLVLKTLGHYKRQLIPVILGVAVAGAIITGALIVGDSVRGSLRAIAMDRIGNIDRVLVAPRWFSLSRMIGDEESVEGIQGFVYLPQSTSSFEPPKSESQSTEVQGTGRVIHRANDMALLGVSSTFWELGTDDAGIGDAGKVIPKRHPEGEQVILNQTLAEALHAKVGDLITLRVSSNALVPAESVLGKRDADTFVLPRWKVIEILPDRGLSRFSLRSDQRPVMNAFVDLNAVQSALDIGDQVNALVSDVKTTNSSQTRNTSSSREALDAAGLLARLQPSSADLGYEVSTVTIPEKATETDTDTAQSDEQTSPSQGASYDSYVHITTDQMLIPSSVEQALLKSLPKENSPYKPRVILTYLANGVMKVNSVSENGTSPTETENADSPPDNETEVEAASKSPDAQKIEAKSVPYSTISGVEWEFLAELLKHSNPKENGQSQNEIETPPSVSKPAIADWVVVNQWLADELSLTVGDRIQIDYFLPETVEGVEIEKNFVATVVAIAPVTEPATPYRRNRLATFDSPPTPFNDPHWTPTVPGITDQDSISNWETPFPLKRTISDRDDAYWNAYRLTPKLFISYENSEKLFGSRFGNTTSIRFDHLSTRDVENLQSVVDRTLKNEMPELGWREIPLRDQQLARSGGSTPFDALFLALSFFVIAAALLLVVLLFRLLIEKRAGQWGLLAASGWTRKKILKVLLAEGAVLVAIGAFVGIALGTAYAYLMLVLLKSWWIGAITVSFLDYHLRPATLLMGLIATFLAGFVAIYVAARRLKRIEVATLLKGRMESYSNDVRPKRWRILAASLLAAGGIICLLLGNGLQGQEQAMAFMGGGMGLMVAGLIWVWQNLSRTDTNTQALSSIGHLASSGVKRAPMRSLLAIAMIAMASFLILSLSFFKAYPTELGTGGFAWVGKAASPIFIELDRPELRREHLGQEAELLTGLRVASIRVRGGDDASCNNLYQANEPQVWGISPRVSEIDRNSEGRSRFAWFQTASNEKSPWSPLEENSDGTKDSPVPVIIDQNTALWALHLGGFVGEEFSYDFDNRKVHFKTVGVLQNTILQGGLVIGENNFQKLFPNITGYRSFLVQVSDSSEQSDTPNSHTPTSSGSGSKTASTRDQLETIQRIMENGWEEQGLSLASSDSILTQLLAVQNTYLAAFQLLGSLGLMLGTLGLAVTQLRSAYERQAELASMRAIGFSRKRLTWLLTLEAAWQLLLGLGIGVGAVAIAMVPANLSGQYLGTLETPVYMLMGILLTGMLTSWIAAKLAMKMPLLASLRNDL